MTSNVQVKPKAPPRPVRAPQVQRADSFTPNDEAERRDNRELASRQSISSGSDTGGVTSDFTRSDNRDQSRGAEAEIDKLKQEIRKKEQEREQQEEEFEKEKKRLRKENKALCDENHALNAAMRQNQTIIENQDGEKDQLDNIVKRKNREIENLKGDVESKEEEFKNQEKELKNEIKIQKKENKIQSEKIEDLERNVQKQKHEHAMTLEKLRFDYEKKLKEISKDSDSKGRELEELTRKIRRTEDEKKQQDKEFQKELKKLRDGIKKLEDEKSSLSKDLQKKEGQIKCQESKIEDLKETKRKQEQTIKSVTEQIDGLKKEVQHLKAIIGQTEAENTKLSADRLNLARAFLQTDDDRAGLHCLHLEDSIQLEILRRQLEDLKTEKFHNLLQNVKRGKCRKRYERYKNKYFFLRPG